MSTSPLSLHSPLINANRLPSGTSLRFSLLAVTITFIGLWYGSIIDNSLTFINPYTTPLNNSASVSFIFAIWFLAFIIYFFHPIHCRLRFGVVRRLQPGDPIAVEISSIARKMGISRLRIFIDADIYNTDAIAFGLPLRRSIAIGRGMSLLCFKHPDRFEARIAHELGHIRNGDIDIAFLEYGLVSSTMLFMICVFFYWTSNFLVYMYGNVYGFSLESIYYYVQLFIRNGLALAASMVAWIAIVWLEHRAFVRSREYLADAEAAFIASPEVVTQTLQSASTRSASPLSIGRVLAILGAHPSHSERRKSLLNLSNVGRPGPGTFFMIGALLSLGASLISVVTGAFSVDDQVEAIAVNGAADVAKIIDLTFSNSDYAFLIVLTTLMYDVIVVCIILMLCRIFIQSLILAESAIKYYLYSFLCSIGYAAGYVFGDTFDPFYIYNNFRGAWANPAIHLNYDLAVSTSKEAIGLFFAMILLRPICRLLITGTRRRRVRTIEWLLFSFLLMMMGGQLALAAFVLLDDVVDMGRTLGSVNRAALYGGAILWSTLFFLSFVTIRRGFWLRNSRGDFVFSPWLFQL
jgi:Zn-dependent protease with chaperone function